jgi:rare lipoprotein A
LCPNVDPQMVPEVFIIFAFRKPELSLVILNYLFDVLFICEAVMRLHLRILAVATIPAWIGLHAFPAAAQTFDERWSIIPNAHAEPAAPNAEPAPAKTPEEIKPATSEEKRATTPEEKTDVQTRPPIVVEPAHGSEDRSGTGAPKRVFSGKASFYSYKTGKTASGATFNPNLPTAAHRSLPFGTKVRVTDLATSRSVEVVITDRGPNVRDRVLDLSLDAARRLGITDRGVAQVRVEVL